MKNHKILKTLLLGFCMSAVLVCAQEATKSGGLEKSKRWGEEEVKEYLALPDLASKERARKGRSLDEISKLLKGKEKVMGYFIIGDVNIQQDEDNSFFISFKLKLGDESLFLVSINDSKSWESERNSLYKHIINSVQLWNNIPKSYVTKKNEKEYILDRYGLFPERSHFDLNKRLLVNISSEKKVSDLESQQKTIAVQDQLIRSLILMF